MGKGTGSGLARPIGDSAAIRIQKREAIRKHLLDLATIDEQWLMGEKSRTISPEPALHVAPLIDHHLLTINHFRSRIVAD